jgi:hypothetical protein
MNTPSAPTRKPVDPAMARKVTEAVTEAFIEDGKAHTAAEIAARIGCSVAAVRATMPNGWPPAGIDHEEDSRPSYSASYRGMETGSHRVTVYQPSREAMRQAVIAVRKG